ncbi:hypothetical protein [Nocardioides panacisoli]|uniref:Uncharacterized protein n=1 Tax=Nocardioides panacisoli TaxID=627624 RepID=A0ABP7I578_9ACTN
MTNVSREPFRPAITCDADVTTMWRTLMQPLGWHTNRLHIILVEDDGRSLPHLVEVDEMPGALTREDAVAVLHLLGHLLETGSAALMFARPGGATLTEADRSSCRELYAAATDAGVRLELIHVGTDTAIVPAPMDEVLPRSA